MYVLNEIPAGVEGWRGLEKKTSLDAEKKETWLPPPFLIGEEETGDLRHGRSLAVVSLLKKISSAERSTGRGEISGGIPSV